MEAITAAVAYYQELPALTMATAFELALMLLEDDVGELEPGQIRRLEDLVPGMGAIREELAELRAGQEAAIEEALRRQAAAACRRVELSEPFGPELGAVLALVPADLPLAVTSVHPGDGCLAAFGEGQAARGPTREAAILAATAKLLGLDEAALRRRVAGSPADVVRAAMGVADEFRGVRCLGSVRKLVDAVQQLQASTAAEPRRTCESCARWSEGEPARGGPSIARWCSLVAGYRQPDAWCDDHCSAATAETDPAPSSDEQQLPGVSVEGNVVRSEGDDDV